MFIGKSRHALLRYVRRLDFVVMNVSHHEEEWLTPYSISRRHVRELPNLIREVVLPTRELHNQVHLRVLQLATHFIPGEITVNWSMPSAEYMRQLATLSLFRHGLLPFCHEAII